MKSVRFEIGMLLLPLIFFTSCVEDAIRDEEKVNLAFNFSLKENKDGRTTSELISPGASVLISVETSHGQVVVDQQEVAIQKDANGYITAPMQLPAGKYRLVDFMVVDESGKIVYATPQEGSELSLKIAQSLPFNFIVGRDKNSENSITVLDTQSKTPKNFGYDSFRRQPHALKLQVYIQKEKKLQSASAEALIMQGVDTLRTYQLSQNMNSISFSGDPSETYSLVVVKDSYARFSQDFSLQNISGKPFKIVLEPALTVVGVTTSDQNYFGMQLDPAWGIFDFMVDWGDGTNQTWTSGITTIVDHFYEQPGQYFISITGHGLDSVVLVGNLVGGGDIARLGLEHLVQLLDFRIEYGVGPKVIDLSNNKLLNEIRIYSHPLGPESPLEELIIPNDAFIYNMEIGGNTKMKPESFNELVNDLHHQVVNRPRSGDFWFSTWEDNNIPMITPSPEALEKIRELKNTYGWNVNPDPDLLGE